MRVRGMKWEDKPTRDGDVDNTNGERSGAVEGQQLAPAPNISSKEGTSPTGAPQIAAKPDDEPRDNSTQDDTSGGSEALAAQSGPPESDSEDQDKKLKRKIGDRLLSTVADRPSSTTGVEPAKRARDDAEEDDNPREKKRPSPPPEENKVVPVEVQPVVPQPKVVSIIISLFDHLILIRMQGGFLAYASTSSPFADAKGPSIFGSKPSPSPFASAPSANPPAWASADQSHSGSTSPTGSGFASASGSSHAQTPLRGFSAFASSSTSSRSAKDLSSSPTGTKRTGFEAFASSTSPFAAAARSKSPTGFGRTNNQTALGAGLGRSKSPPRRGAPFGSPSAFKSYAGSSSQAFAVPAPPVKKQRQDPGSESSSETGEGADPAKVEGTSSLSSVFNGEGSPDGSEEESDKQTFGERLRAGKNDEDNIPAGSDDEDSRVAVTEQEGWFYQ